MNGLVNLSNGARAGLRDRLLLLRSQPTFDGLDDEGILLLAEHGRAATYRDGDVIVAEGEPARAAFIITAGRCEVRKRDASDPTRTVTVRTLVAGQVFGETAIFADAPRSASVIAVDEVSAVVVERHALEELMRNSFLGQFVKALADRFLEHDARLSELQGGAADEP